MRVGQYRIPADIAGAGPRRSSVGVSRRAGRARRRRADRRRGRAAVRQPRVRRPRLRRSGPRDRGARARARSRRRTSRPAAGTIAARFERAAELRRLLFGAALPQAMRVFAGESEGLPGVTVDRYGDFVVVAVAVARARCPGATSSTARSSRPGGRAGSTSSGGLRPLAGGGAARAGGARARRRGAARARRRETAAAASASTSPRRSASGCSPTCGSAGRRSRRAPPGGACSNLFSYTGAFSVHAAKAGAAEVVAVDTARQGARARPPQLRAVRARSDARHETLTADAIKTLERFASRGRRFDIVVCDPPTFSHGPAGQFSVARDLAQLAAACAAVLAPGGFLVFASNSTKLSRRRARPRARRGSGAARRAELRIIERVGLPPDFPVAPGFPEGNYLKVAIAIRAAVSRGRRSRESSTLPPADVCLSGLSGRLPRALTSSRYCRTVPSTVSLKCTWPLGDLAQRGHGRLVVARDQRTAAVGQLARALGAENDQRETVVDPLETIFDGDASQVDLQGNITEPWEPRSATKARQSSRCRTRMSKRVHGRRKHQAIHRCKAQRSVANARARLLDSDP